MSGVKGTTRLGSDHALVATQDTRGLLVSEIGNAGVADKLVYVSKDATDTYVRNQIVPGAATDPTVAAIAALGSNGILTKVASGSVAARTLTAGSSKITVTNGNGVSGNPTIDLGTVPESAITGLVSDLNTLATSIAGKQALSTLLTAIAALAGTGLIVQTGAGTVTERSIAAGPSTNISVTNGDGVSGNPTVDLVSSPSVTGLTVTSATSLQGLLRYAGGGSTPTISPLTAAGTGATTSAIAGDGFHCDFNLTAGTGPTTGAMVQINFGTTLANANYIAEIHRRNANAAGPDWYVGTRGTSSVQINCNTVLTASQTYALTVVVKGRN